MSEITLSAEEVYSCRRSDVILIKPDLFSDAFSPEKLGGTALEFNVKVNKSTGIGQENNFYSKINVRKYVEGKARDSQLCVAMPPGIEYETQEGDKPKLLYTVGSLADSDFVVYSKWAEAFDGMIRPVIDTFIKVINGTDNFKSSKIVYTKMVDRKSISISYPGKKVLRDDQITRLNSLNPETGKVVTKIGSFYCMYKPEQNIFFIGPMFEICPEPLLVEAPVVRRKRGATAKPAEESSDEEEVVLTATKKVKKSKSSD